MDRLIKELGDKATVMGNIIISNKEDETTTMLFVKDSGDKYDVTIDRDDFSVYEASLAGDVPVDFSIAKATLMDLGAETIFELAILFGKFGNNKWYSVQQLAKKILAIGRRKRYSISTICHILAESSVQQIRRLSEQEDPWQSFLALVD